MTKSTFTAREFTRIYKSYSGEWQGETHVKIDGKNWVVNTMKRSGGKIATHCKVVQDEGGGAYSFTMFDAAPANEEFWLNDITARATEKTIKEIHLKSLADLDAKREAGDLPKAQTEYEVKIGQVLFTDFIRFDDQNHRAVYKIEGNKYYTVSLDGSKTQIDQHIRPYSRKFGIGVYYYENECISEDEVNALLIDAKENMTLAAAADEAQSIIDAEQAKAKAQYLSQFKKASNRERTNILKAHIAKTWPAVKKVSVKYDCFSGGSSLDITYQAPAEIEDLENFIKGFQEGSFNSMEDIYEYNDRPEIIINGYILNREKWVSARFEKVEEIASAPVVCHGELAEPSRAGIKIVDYSEKSIAIFDERTREIKDELKAIGGRFNPYLTNPKTGEKSPGWVFSKKQREALNNLLNKVK